MALNQYLFILKLVILHDTSVCHAHKVLIIEVINRAGSRIYSQIEAGVLYFIALYLAQFYNFVRTPGE